MLALIDFLNNREKASVFWLALVLAYAFTQNGRAIAGSLMRLGRAAVQRKLVALGGLVAGYSAGLVYVASRLGLWHEESLKETIYWFVGTALILAGETVGSPGKPDLVRRVLRRTFRFTVLLEFFIGLYVLPLWAEFVVVPIVLLFVMMQPVVAGNSAYNDQIRSFISGVLGFVGIALFVWCVVSVVHDVHGFFSRSNAERLLMPAALSVALIPLLYSLSWYSAWELRRLRGRFPLTGYTPEPLRLTRKKRQREGKQLRKGSGRGSRQRRRAPHLPSRLVSGRKPKEELAGAPSTNTTAPRHKRLTASPAHHGFNSGHSTTPKSQWASARCTVIFSWPTVIDPVPAGPAVSPAGFSPVTAGGPSETTPT